MFWFLIPAFTLIGWLFSLWNDLPTEVKKIVIEAIIRAFSEIFKAYYKSKKS